MQLSTKSRYAIRAMVELAISYGQGPVNLKEIAKKQGLSEKYLEQVLAPVRASGLIYTQKGSKGGYFLSTAPEEITLYDIINSIEGSLALVSCVDHPDSCKRKSICVTRDVWVRLKDLMTEELKSVTLHSLKEKQKINN